jgi:hypothetical protein
VNAEGVITLQNPVMFFKADSEIGTTDSTDFTDFEEVIEDDRTNLLVAKCQGLANCNLLYL